MVNSKMEQVGLVMDIASEVKMATRINLQWRLKPTKRTFREILFFSQGDNSLFNFNDTILTNDFIDPDIEAVSNDLYSDEPESNSLTIFSYNSTGFSLDRVKFMKDLFLLCDAGIVALQETMILRSNSFKITNAFPEYDHFILPAKKSTDNVHSG